jgi:LPXTG-site transpeptidase (sortase) family protein
MRRRPLLTVGLALTVLAVALLTWVMQRGGESAQASPASTQGSSLFPSMKPPAPTKAPATDGVRLRIPAIGLDQMMHGAGVSSEGRIDPDPGTVMWFQGFDRVRPGSVGTAVIAAHVVSGGRADVFANLADVAVGDKVEVYENGRTIAYRVTRASVIDKNAVTTDQEVWGPRGSRSRLAIITCDDALGFRSDGHRKANYVVIAERA